MVRRGMNPTLSNARSVKKINHISALCTFQKDNNKRDSYNKLNSLSFSGVKSLDKGITFPLRATTALQEKKSENG